MITPGDIENKTFGHAVMGGYRVEDVDEFFFTLCEDYKKLYLENADTKKKMGIIVEKIEEYRKDEESIKNAIISSQKIKDDSIREAEKKAQEIISEAETRASQIEREAQQKVDSINEQYTVELERLKKENHAAITLEEKALETIKKEVSAFKNKLQDMYKAHIKLITSLPSYEIAEEQPIEEPKVEIKEPIIVIEEKVNIEINDAAVAEKVRLAIAEENLFNNDETKVLPNIDFTVENNK